MTKTRKRYSSDLSPEQEELIKELLPPVKPGGRPRSVDTTWQSSLSSKKIVLYSQGG